MPFMLDEIEALKISAPTLEPYKDVCVKEYKTLLGELHEVQDLLNSIVMLDKHKQFVVKTTIGKLKDKVMELEM